MEKGTMLQKPRKITDTFLNWNEMGTSIIQGLAITIGVLCAYQYTVYLGGDEQTTRAMVFTTLIFANIFLSLTNRSFKYSMLDSFNYKNKLFPIVISVTLLLLSVILYVPFAANFFRVVSLTIAQLGTALLIAAGCVLWFEVYKLIKRMA